MLTSSLVVLVVLEQVLAQPGPNPADAATPAAVVPLPTPLDFFPVATQFSPLPSGEGWKGDEGPLSEETIRATIDAIRAHGFTGIEGPTHRPAAEEACILEYAQSCGMFVTWHAGALENFGRDHAPDPSVYAPEYAATVRTLAQERLKPLKDIPRLYNVFTYQDEPFTAGPASFGYGDAVKAEFEKRYGYPLPEDLDDVRDDPKRWGDLMEFRTAKFPDGWRKTYRIIKEINPSFKVTLTHDSHNTFGAGYGSHAVLAIDDIFHWGGDFADLFVFDMYPYMMFDFRFGEPSRLPKPRISQAHYAFAQMRNLTRAYEKDLGFWFGTYNPRWFSTFLCPELKAMTWAEREMSATAVAAGANYLLSGYQIPIDDGHWAALGEGLRLIQKAGGRILAAPKVKAKACMLFPRTQYIQLQEEYFDVGLSFELFLRAFGELDILHEDQVVDDRLDGYAILVLFDVRLLPKEVMEHIASFVERGGVVIADCVPQLDADRRPMEDGKALFGVANAETGRVTRSGCWVPHKNTHPPAWFARPENAPDESVFTSDVLHGTELDALAGTESQADLPIVSPRKCTATTGQVLAAMASESPAVFHRSVGKGQVYLLGFCAQDTYFKTWQDDNAAARAQLRALLAALPRKAGIRAHVHSSNPDIEASVRANANEGFLFAINHEAASDQAKVRIADLAFPVKEVRDLGSGAPVNFTADKETISFHLSLPTGGFRILELFP